VLGNAEVANIFKAIGVPPGAELEDVEKRRYGKIILMTDADVDGSHIRTLLLTFIFRHMRELVNHGCVYIAQPPLYRVLRKNQRKNEPARYVQTHEQMMAELVGLGKADSTLKFDDGTMFEGEHFDRLVDLISQLEEPLETLERRGIDLRYLVHNHLTLDGMLPRYRVFLGREQRWFAEKSDLDEFLAHLEKQHGGELPVSDEARPLAGPETNGEPDEAEADEALQVFDLHEIRIINQTLKRLKEYGITTENLLLRLNKAGEPLHPYIIKNPDGDVPLATMRELVPTLRKLGEKGLRLTRFKGLGEMDPEELWETSMDAEQRLLLQVTMEDAAAADEIFRVLMGDHVEPRREFIEKHALEVKDLDV
jgi:DNA gyrase subunit B